MKSARVTHPHPHPETQQILDAIRRIVRALRISSRFSEKALGLSSAQLYVLQKLGETDGSSINELAERTLTHQSSVSAVVSKLVARRLAFRRKSRQDARRAEISLTPKGLALIRRAPQQPIQERLIAAIETLPNAGRKSLARSIISVVRAAGIGDGPVPLFFEESSK
jgi:DNA-binding MarR family transcriptional regulator